MLHRKIEFVYNLILFLSDFFCRPHDTPFEDGTFKLTIEFTEEYPNKPPTVRFVSKMFHPNGKFVARHYHHNLVLLLLGDRGGSEKVPFPMLKKFL